MSNLTRNFPTARAACGPASELLFPNATIKSGVQMYQGGLVFRAPADSQLLVTDPSVDPMLEPYGISDVSQLGDGNLEAMLEWGPHPLDNSATSGETVPTGLPMGWPLYAKDNHTVSIVNRASTTLYPFAGWFGGWTGEDTPRPIVWVGFCPFALTELLIPVSKGHADLTEAATTQDFTLYTLLGPARVIAPPTVDALSAFSGGGTAAGTIAIGADSDPDAIGDQKSIFTGGSTGAMTAGVLGYPGALLVAGTVIKAQFEADTTVAAFSAGSVTATLRLRPGN